MGRSLGGALVRNGTGAPARRAGLIGVVDVGSNTARLVVFDAAESGAVRPILEAKEVPRLGAGLGARGELAPDAIERGVEGMARFAKVLKSCGVARTIAVTTSAVRDAPNGPEFIEKARRASGIELAVLSGTEEARYGYLGIASAWALHDDLLIDLGGGSLQIVRTRAGRVANSVSLPLGVLRVTQRFVEHDPPKPREIDALREYVRTTLQTTLEAFGGSGERVYAVGGTVRASARAAIEMRDYPVRRVHGYPLGARDLDALLELVAEMPIAKRRAIPGIGNDRADVLVGGLVVLSEMLRASKSAHLTVTGTGIREGLAVEAIGAELPVRAEELAMRSAMAAAERFSFSLERGRAIAALTGELFDLLAPEREWGASERLALTVAAWMHDVGTSIDLWRHAHHSAYLLQNYPIAGLEPRETLLAASIVAQHTKDELPPGWRKGFAPVLRPADLATGRRLGAVLQTCGLLLPARPRFQLAEAARQLTIAFSIPADTVLPPRTLEQARKPIEREFDLEVRMRDGG